MNNDKINYPNIIIAVTSIIIAITGILGLLLVKNELENLSLQNNLLSKSVRASYRPLGIIRYIDPNKPKSRIISLLKIGTGPKDKFTFHYNPSLINVGNGPLISIGHIYAMLDKRESLRKRILSNNLLNKKIKFDGKYTGARRLGLSIKEVENSLVTKFESVDFQKYYYINIISFYEDQDGNLYDTEHRIVFELGEPYWENDRLTADLKSATPLNYFHSYSAKDKSLLIDFIKSQGHSLWEYFSK